MKNTLTFSVQILAPRQRVWDTTFDDAGYRAWTAAFAEGSHFTGSWEQGSKIRFMSPSGDGMSAVIEENRPGEFLSIRHVGEINQGVEDTESPKVKAWAPVHENYTFTDVAGGTELVVTLDAVAEYEAYMRETFPKALALLKQICEQKPAA